MSQVPVLPPNSKLTIQLKSTIKKPPSFEEYNAILENYPPPSTCKALFCTGSQFGADINAGALVEKPYETREEWCASIVNHASNSTEPSPFVSATTNRGLAMEWIVQKRDEKGTQLCVIDPIKLKPGSMIEMNWALDMLGGSPRDGHNTKVLIWQSIPAAAVEDRMFLKDVPVLIGFLEEPEPGKVTEEEYQVDCDLYLQSKTKLSFKDWWIARLPKGPEPVGSKPGIRRIVESFRHTKDL